MDFKKLANQAKEQAQGVSEKAKKEIDRRGGTEGLKASAKTVTSAAKGKSSIADKAKAAAAAAKTEAKK